MGGASGDALLSRECRRWVLGRLHREHRHAIDELVAAQGDDAHVKEDPVEHGHRDLPHGIHCENGNEDL